MATSPLSRLSRSVDHSYRPTRDGIVACRRGWDEPVLTVGPPAAGLLLALGRVDSLSCSEVAALLDDDEPDAIVAALTEAGLVHEPPT